MVNTSKSTEDILKLIDHVSYKKTEGKLYLMAERLAWMTNTSDVFKISEHYKNIRAQRISPDDKDKVQLQLLMHSGSSFTFHFIHPDGRNRHIADRNSVKISLQYLIPRFKEKAQSELETKRKLCESNPQILELYRELVTNKYVCKEEFWQLTESSNDQQSPVNEYSKLPRGIPSCLLATPPQKDGKSQQCNLSKRMVDDIFAVYPAVQHKHAQLVPTDMSEEEFWNKFFQSHYFHRFKSDLTNDRFASCAHYDIAQISQEAQRLRRESLTLLVDRSGDLGEFCCPSNAGADSNVPGGGIANGGSDDNCTEPTVSSSSAEELLRRFNRQSFLILKTMRKSRPRGNNDEIDLDSGETGAGGKVARFADNIHDDAERRLIDGGNSDAGQPDGTVPFNSDKVTDYVTRIARAGVTTGPLDNVRRLSADECMRKMTVLRQAVANQMSGISSGQRPLPPNQQHHHLMTSSVATDVLTDIGHLFSDADIAMTSSSSSSLSFAGGQPIRNAGKIPLEMIRDIKSLYRVAAELFRHFWSCFPVTDAAGFEKLHRMVDAIKRFRGQRIDVFMQQHPNYYLLTGSIDTRPIDHLCRMADRVVEAFDRYLANYKRVNKIV